MKYALAYTLPLIAALGFYWGGAGLYAVVVYAFVLLPVMEVLLPQNTKNLDQEVAESRKRNPVYDWMLYLNLPIVFALLAYVLTEVAQNTHSASELTGYVLSMGIVLGANAINVAHELGHRDAFKERVLAKILLIPTFYGHFYVEHNHGHHLDVGTPNDPSSARYNQSLFFFWPQAVFGTYAKAWKLQTKLNQINQRTFWSFKNDMLLFTGLHISYLLIVFFTLGKIALLTALLSGIVGILLLETINYIEHYGLRRKRLASGRFERVSEIHSWNSNHILGRIVLYELTRHSDHHYKSNKKYQLLNCHQTSPQLPFGYPTSMVLAFLPPLWFAVMNKRVPDEMRTL